MRMSRPREIFARISVVPNAQDGDSTHTASFIPPKDTGPFQVFAPIFLGQARLYALADKYGVESLCHLVLSKTYEILKSFQIYQTGVDGILEFVRFVYSNTPPTYVEVDPMRNLITRYVVTIIPQIGATQSFRELLKEGGDFVADFWHSFWDSDPNL